MSATRDGGKPNVSQIPYSPPAGPKGQSHNAPGLGGTNFGNCQCMDDGKPMSSGSPGIGGMNHGKSPTQRG
jgi:hypothetical protein